MDDTDRNRYWIQELDSATRYAMRCQAHCTQEAHALFAFALSRLQACQTAVSSMSRIDIQVRAFRSMLSSVVFADLMGIALPAARPRLLALARTLCESELPVSARDALRFLLRANTLQGRLMDIQRAEAFRADHPARPAHMNITTPDGW